MKRRAQTLLQRRVELDETVWAEERLSQQYELTFVNLWDRLRGADDKFRVLSEFAVEDITLGEASEARMLPEGIRVAALDRSPRTLDLAAWRAFLHAMQQRGFRLVQSEWHHEQFRRDESGERYSVFQIVLHVADADDNRRYEVSGPIRVAWSNRRDGSGRFLPASVDATGLSVTWREEKPAFEQVELAEFPLRDGFLDSVLAHDLNDDGLSDLVFPGQNLVFWNEGRRRFRRAELVSQPISVVYHAVLADLTSDGLVDYLVAGGLGVSYPGRFGLYLYEGQGSGRFGISPRLTVDPAGIDLQIPSCYAVGDIDTDGDLDVFVGQYKNPYINGQFPDPYYDANDGYSAYALINDGTGRFADATEDVGLGRKRFRRTYGCSFVDLDQDADLDLVVVSDFAGIDVYSNDGRGHFTDVTDTAVDVAANFGMSHAVADFNRDGLLDLYVTGMASTTARRLEQMGVGRDDLPEHTSQRIEMGYGNRMYLSQGGGQFRQPSFGDRVARSGWTWGVAAPDVNNDGYPDLYAANGHISGSTALDYCTRFWTQDIYSGSAEDLAQLLVFSVEEQPRSNEGISWNGFEHNRLFLNLGGADFTSAAFLMGVALEEDSRVVIADDFDADGRVDFLVTALVGDASRAYLLFNGGNYQHHWIGVRLRDAPRVSAIGSQITITHAGGRQSATVVTGESFLAQHAFVRHFGLGDSERVAVLEVRWPDGAVTRLVSPAVDRYHTVTHPGAS